MTRPDSTGVARTILKSTLMLTVADLTTRLTTLVVTFMISRRLGVASLGIYTTATATYALIATAGGLGATNYMVREIAKKPEDTGRFFLHVALMGIALSVVLTGGFWTLLPHLGYSQELATGMSIIVIALLPGTLNTLMQAVFIAHQRVVFITYTTALAAVVNIAVSWWMIASGMSVSTLLAAFVLGQTAVTVTGLAVIHLRIAPMRWSFDRSFAKAIALEIRTFAALSLLAAIFAQPEILMLSFLKSEVEVGYFGAAFRLISFWMIIPAVLMSNVFPYMARVDPRSDQSRRLQHVSLKFLMIATLPVAAGIAAAAGPIIRLVYGPGYEASVAPLRIMSLILVFNAFDQVYWRALAARNEQRKDLVVRVISAVFRVASGIAIISLFGVEGAAWSAAASVAGAAMLLALYVRRDGTPLRIPTIAGRSAAAALGMGAIVWIAARRLGLPAVIGVGVVAYVVFIWVLRVLASDDIELLTSIYREKRKVGPAN